MVAKLFQKTPSIYLQGKLICLGPEGMKYPEKFSSEIKEEFAKIEAILLPDGAILT